LGERGLVGALDAEGELVGEDYLVVVAAWEGGGESRRKRR